MLQLNAQELNRIKAECEALVRRRARLAALAAVVPVPGLDVAAEARLLGRLLPEITARFGLSPEDIREMPTAQREQAAWRMRNHVPGFCGQVAPGRLLRRSLGEETLRLLATQVAKLVPVTGTAVAGWLGYAVVARIARRYIDACHEVASTLWSNPGRPPQPAGGA